MITNEYQLQPLQRLCTAFVGSSSSPATALARRNDLRQLLAFMSGDPDKLLLGDYTGAVVDKFMAHMLSIEAPSNVVRRFWTFRAFDKWLAQAIPDFKKPTGGIKPPTVEQKKYRGISEDDAARLIAAAYKMGNTESIRLRNGVAVELLYNTGLRASEAIALREEQLSKDGRWFHEVKCKGKHFRDVYIPKSFDENLNAWMKVRKFILRSWGVRRLEVCPIILPMRKPSELRGPESLELYEKGLWNIVSTAAAHAGLEDVHPHTLRHGFAHELLESTNDVRLVQQALGHKSIETTMRYTERSHDRMAEMIEGAKNGKARSRLPEGENGRRAAEDTQPSLAKAGTGDTY